jgi:hypothetical protein
LQAPNDFIFALEAKHPNLPNGHDVDLYEIVTRGRFKGKHGPVCVRGKQQDATNSSSAAWEAR